jgi:uncharacterized membrane protein YidH (DUF202 family)
LRPLVSALAAAARVSSTVLTDVSTTSARKSRTSLASVIIIVSVFVSVGALAHAPMLVVVPRRCLNYR